MIDTILSPLSDTDDSTRSNKSPFSVSLRGRETTLDLTRDMFAGFQSLLHALSAAHTFRGALVHFSTLIFSIACQFHLLD